MSSWVGGESFRRMRTGGIKKECRREKKMDDDDLIYPSIQ